MGDMRNQSSYFTLHHKVTDEDRREGGTQGTHLVRLSHGNWEWICWIRLRNISFTSGTAFTESSNVGSKQQKLPSKYDLIQYFGMQDQVRQMFLYIDRTIRVIWALLLIRHWDLLFASCDFTYINKQDVGPARRHCSLPLLVLSMPDPPPSNVPVEIIYHIFENLAPSSLASAAQANSSLQVLSEKFIYKDLQLTSVPQAIQCCQTLLAKPSIAQAVRHFTLLLDRSVLILS